MEITVEVDPPKFEALNVRVMVPITKINELTPWPTTETLRKLYKEAKCAKVSPFGNFKVIRTINGRQLVDVQELNLWIESHKD